MQTDSQQSESSAQLHAELLQPRKEFEAEYAARVIAGGERLSRSSIAVVGLARNCATTLAHNLARLLDLARCCRAWRLHVETNDNTDQTDQVLADFCREYRQATFTSQRLDRQQFSAEFAGRRTVALAEYRAACQRWVRENAADADYVIVIDWDAWGGWWHDGVLNGVGWLVELPGAYGMASVSLFQMLTPKPQWCHYDLWALRGLGQPRCFWDTYQNGYGAWGFQWLPPVGSPPVLVSSAFGGMAIYRTDAYLAGTYTGDDCEHVPFHRSIAEATGQNLYVCPGMRTIMSWLENADGGQHGDD